MLSADLNCLKYHELQKLAKNAGIRANQKVDKLRDALEKYYIDHEERVPLKDAESQMQVKPVVNSSKSSPAELRHPSDGNQVKFPQNLKRSDIASESGALSKPSQENEAPKGTTRSKKRRRTFELDEPTLSPQLTPSMEGVQARVGTGSDRRTRNESGSGPRKRARVCQIADSENLTTPVLDNMARASRSSRSSPSTKAMIESISGEGSSEERRAHLMEVLEKKVKEKATKQAAPNLSPAKGQPSHIPRFMAFLANKGKDKPSKPVTPGNKDWARIHEKEFSKFDSLDVYLEKKQKRIENLTGSAKQRRQTTKTKADSVKVQKPAGWMEKKQSAAIGMINKKRPSGSAKAFVPSVVSVKNASFNFQQHTRRTPAKTAGGQDPVTPGQKSNRTPGRPGSVTTGQKSTTRVPYVFKAKPTSLAASTSSANKTLPSSAHKKVFDLKASLSKPLSWKPYTGRLQPMDTNTNTASTALFRPTQPSTSKLKPALASDKKMAHSQVFKSKTRQTQAKDVRRVQQLTRRNNQKYTDMMKRRGLMV